MSLGSTGPFDPSMRSQFRRTEYGDAVVRALQGEMGETFLFVEEDGAEVSKGDGGRG